MKVKKEVKMANNFARMYVNICHIKLKQCQAYDKMVCTATGTIGKDALAQLLPLGQHEEVLIPSQEPSSIQLLLACHVNCLLRKRLQ